MHWPGCLWRGGGGWKSGGPLGGGGGGGADGGGWCRGGGCWGEALWRDVTGVVHEGPQVAESHLDQVEVLGLRRALNEQLVQTL